MRDLPSGWVKILVAVIAAVAAIVPIVLLRPQSTTQPSTTVPAVGSVPTDAASVEKDKARKECIKAVLAVPPRILRLISQEQIREAALECSNPFKPPVSQTRTKPP